MQSIFLLKKMEIFTAFKNLNVSGWNDMINAITHVLCTSAQEQSSLLEIMRGHWYLYQLNENPTLNIIYIVLFQSKKSIFTNLQDCLQLQIRTSVTFMEVGHWHFISGRQET